ncbi:MAG: hypothetical protein JW846_05895 [Dehalococcoidia bacterium]|nr:hypothetical protein [Dehalococcoidia bacterium]
MKRDIGYEFKQSLAAGNKAFGPLIGPGNDAAPTVEAIKEFGYDFFMIDNEHSMVDKESIYTYIRLAREHELLILMRPEENNANFRSYLDSGVQGLMLPQVDTVERAAFAVNQSFFPPLGHRGAGLGMSPYLLDGMDPSSDPLLDMIEYVNRNVLLFPQTESLAGVKSLPQVLRLDGIAGTIVGTNDLALDIGDIKPGMLRNEVNSQPFIEGKLREIVAVCREAGKVAGMGGFPPEGCARWAREGYQLFTLGYIRDNNAEKFRPVLQEARELIG